MLYYTCTYRNLSISILLDCIDAEPAGLAVYPPHYPIGRLCRPTEGWVTFGRSQPLFKIQP